MAKKSWAQSHSTCRLCVEGAGGGGRMDGGEGDVYNPGKGLGSGIVCSKLPTYVSSNVHSNRCTVVCYD